MKRVIGSYYFAVAIAFIAGALFQGGLLGGSYLPDGGLLSIGLGIMLLAIACGHIGACRMAERRESFNSLQSEPTTRCNQKT